MQSVSAEFTTASAASGRRPVAYLEVSWDLNGAFLGARGSSGWTDESGYLISHEGELRINPPGELLVPAGNVGRATIKLDNTSQRFSWLRTDGPLYAYIGGATGLIGKKIRIWQGFILPDGSREYVCIFSGFITSWQESTAQGQVILECQDRGWRLLQDRRSTAVYQDQRPDQWIAYVMGLAGFNSSHWLLDVGIYHIPWAWMDDESVVTEVWDTAEADGGLAYFDQLGKLRFENMLHWASGEHLTSQWTFDEGTYVLAAPRINPDALATEVTLEWSGRSKGQDTDLYVLDDKKVINPSQTETWVARFDYAALAIYDPSASDPYNDYAAASFGGVDVTDDLDVTLSNKYGQQCTVAVTNNNNNQAALLTYLRIRGQPLVGGPSEQASATASPAPFTFDRVRSLRGNPYMQTLAQGKALATVLALRGRRVRPVWMLTGVPGIPQLELTDHITFKDTRSLGSGQTVEAIVTRMRWQFGLDTGFVQEIGAMDVTDLAEYDDYFVIGTTALGTHGRAYH